MMRLLSVLVCATTLLCVTASSISNNAVLPRASECNFNPPCDSTGEEKVPIPCEGYCDAYYFCQNGKFTFHKCPKSLFSRQQKFNNVRRQCEASFDDCDWWREDKPTTTNPTDPDPNQPTTQPPPDSSSPSIGTTEPTIEPTTEGPCTYNANCDPTGVEHKPIPCGGYCNKYYLCEEGKQYVKDCARFQNFDNVTRQCSFTFKDCNWYKDLVTTTSPSPNSPSTNPPPTNTKPSVPTTQQPPKTTSKPGNRASSLVYSTTSLLLSVFIPLLSRYI